MVGRHSISKPNKIRAMILRCSALERCGAQDALSSSTTELSWARSTRSRGLNWGLSSYYALLDRSRMCVQ
jgi:hypothetical protein